MGEKTAGNPFNNAYKLQLTLVKKLVAAARRQEEVVCLLTSHHQVACIVDDQFFPASWLTDQVSPVDQNDMMITHIVKYKIYLHESDIMRYHLDRRQMKWYISQSLQSPIEKLFATSNHLIASICLGKTLTFQLLGLTDYHRLNAVKNHIGQLGDILLAQGFQLDLLRWRLWHSSIISFSPAELWIVVISNLEKIHKIWQQNFKLSLCPFFQPVLPWCIELVVVALDLSKSSVTGVGILNPFFGQHLQNDQRSVTLCCHPEGFVHVSCVAAGFQGCHQRWKCWEAIQGQAARSASFVDFVADPAQQILARVVQTKGCTKGCLLGTDLLWNEESEHSPVKDCLHFMEGNSKWLILRLGIWWALYFPNGSSTIDNAGQPSYPCISTIRVPLTVGTSKAARVFNTMSQPPAALDQRLHVDPMINIIRLYQHTISLLNYIDRSYIFISTVYINSYIISCNKQILYYVVWC